MRLHTPNPSFTAETCEFPPYAFGPLWTFQAPLYEPADFDALPNEIVLNTTDCSARPLTMCDCSLGNPVTTEGLLNGDMTLWEATYGGPEAYIAFTDDGCAARIRYGNEAPATADFASKLMAVYGGRRWGCASSGTHFLMFHTVRANGPN
ncbi:MAG: hypothetical protein M3O36_13470 [Myxococcota bacterium]|nr:hypothetical protein [Myxococcota bacterium]